MKKLLLVLVVAVVTFLSSCSKDETYIINWQDEQCTDFLYFRMVTDSSSSQTTKAGEYERGEAPAYISGVELSARNLDYADAPIVDGIFDFVEEGNQGGKRIGLSGVIAGDNEFKAKSRTIMPQVYNTVLDLQKVKGKTLKERAEQYNVELLERHPIYAKYDATISPVEIKKENNEVIVYDMGKSKIGRLNLIIETTKRYDVHLKAGLKSGLLIDTWCTTGDLVNGIILNDNYCIDGAIAEIKIDIYVVKKNGKIGKHVDSINLDDMAIEAGKNIVHVINYSPKGGFVRGNTKTNFKWEVVEDVYTDGDTIE